jgi:hypothetical protein
MIWQERGWKRNSEGNENCGRMRKKEKSKKPVINGSLKK